MIVEDLIQSLAAARRDSDERRNRAEVAAIVEGQLPRAWQAVRAAIYAEHHDDAERGLRLLAAILTDRGMAEWLPGMLSEVERLQRPGWRADLLFGRLLALAIDVDTPEGTIGKTLADAAANGVRPDPDELQGWFTDCAATKGIPSPAKERKPEKAPPSLVVIPNEPEPKKAVSPVAAVDATPRKLLSGWQAICQAVEMRWANRNEVKSLNKRFEGPIKSPGTGKKPVVYLDELLGWWNTLAVKQTELVNTQRGAKLSAEDQYEWGRSGTAAPEIAGSVKKRRRPNGT